MFYLFSIILLFIVFSVIVLILYRRFVIRLEQVKKTSEDEFKNQLCIFEALSRDYKNIFQVDPIKKTATVLKLAGYVTKGLERGKTSTVPYDVLAGQYIKDRVYSEDMDFMKKVMALDNVLENLSKSDEYITSYRVLDNGEIHFYQAKYMVLENKDIIAGFNNIDDAVKAAKERATLLVLSETDSMTGLLNRGSGEKRVDEALQLGKGGFFCLLDIDNFKMINDTFGHEVGDLAIKSIAKCLKVSFNKEDDVVFRLGGDEFSVYSRNVKSEEEARELVQNFYKEIAQIKIPNFNDKKITVSIGATIIPEGKSVSFLEKYRLIDTCVYESKRNCGNAICFK